VELVPPVVARVRPALLVRALPLGAPVLGALLVIAWLLMGLPVALPTLGGMPQISQ
jgi:hypothetical protein